MGWPWRWRSLWRGWGGGADPQLPAGPGWEGQGTEARGVSCRRRTKGTRGQGVGEWVCGATRMRTRLALSPAIPCQPVHMEEGGTAGDVCCIARAAGLAAPGIRSGLSATPHHTDTHSHAIPVAVGEPVGEAVPVPLALWLGVGAADGVDEAVRVAMPVPPRVGVLDGVAVAAHRGGAGQGSAPGVEGIGRVLSRREAIPGRAVRRQRGGGVFACKPMAYVKKCGQVGAEWRGVWRKPCNNSTAHRCWWRMVWV